MFEIVAFVIFGMLIPYGAVTAPNWLGHLVMGLAATPEEYKEYCEAYKEIRQIKREIRQIKRARKHEV